MSTVEGQLLSELTRLGQSVARNARKTLRASELAERAIKGIEEYLNRPVRVAILGEENSGKSLFLNYLLKHQILPSNRFFSEETEILVHYAPEPSASIVGRDGHRNRLTSRAFGVLSRAEAQPKPQSSNIIYQSSDAASGDHSPGPRKSSPLFTKSKKTVRTPPKLIEVGLPLEVLKHVELLEVRSFPGYGHSSPAGRAFQRVDLSIWCTLSTQAWKETEAVSWGQIPLARRQLGLMLVTYKDAIHAPKDEQKILERLKRSNQAWFNDVLLVSLRDAVASLLADDEESGDALRDASNVAAVEKALTDVVQEQRIRRLRKAIRLLRFVDDVTQRQDGIFDPVPASAPDVNARLRRISGAARTSPVLTAEPVARLGHGNRAPEGAEEAAD